MSTSFALSILLAAPDGIMSRSIQTLLSTICQTGMVRTVIDLSAAIESLRWERTQILLLDDDLLVTACRDELEELREFIQQCHSIQPELAISVLLRSLVHKHEVQELGVQALLKGMLDEELRRLPVRVFAARK